MLLSKISRNHCLLVTNRLDSATNIPHREGSGFQIFDEKQNCALQLVIAINKSIFVQCTTDSWNIFKCVYIHTAVSGKCQLI